MSKAVVKTVFIYTSLTSIFIALFILLTVTMHSNIRLKGHHGLSRRLGYKIHGPLFDPLIAKIERLVKEKGLDHEGILPNNWETSPLANDLDLEDVDEYLNEEGNLNTTTRLIHLYPNLDISPHDGFVDIRELQAWIVQQANERLDYWTHEELKSQDRDGDGLISLNDYLPHISDEDFEKNGMEQGEAGWWKEKFMNADIDQNGLLNFQEFRDFLHPEDSGNEEIHKWLLREKIKPKDYDQDEKLNFEEFRNGVYDIFKSNVEFDSGINMPYPYEVFGELDVNKDNFLTLEELQPALSSLCPGEISYAKYYASYLFYEADENGDGKLSLDEMISNEALFYTTVHDDDDDVIDDNDFHEEL